MLGVANLARVFASFRAACTHHTFMDVVLVIIIAAFLCWYDWNFHILQVDWQLVCVLKSEGKNIVSVMLLPACHCQLLYRRLFIRTVTFFPFNIAACLCFSPFGFLCNISKNTHTHTHTHICISTFLHVFWKTLCNFKGNKIPSLNSRSRDKKYYIILYYVYIWTIS